MTPNQETGLLVPGKGRGAPERGQMVPAERAAARAELPRCKDRHGLRRPPLPARWVIHVKPAWLDAIRQVGAKLLLVLLKSAAAPVQMAWVGPILA